FLDLLTMDHHSKSRLLVSVTNRRSPFESILIAASKSEAGPRVQRAPRNCPAIALEGLETPPGTAHVPRSTPLTALGVQRLRRLAERLWTERSLAQKMLQQHHQGARTPSISPSRLSQGRSRPS